MPQLEQGEAIQVLIALEERVEDLKELKESCEGENPDVPEGVEEEFDGAISEVVQEWEDEARSALEKIVDSEHVDREQFAKRSKVEL